MKRTILTVTDYLDPERPGGAARVAWELARALAARGHTCPIAAGLTLPIPPREEGNLHAAWFAHAPTRPWRMRGEVRRTVEKLLAGRRPDALILHQPLTAWMVGGMPELADVPAVYFFHSPWHREYELNRDAPGLRTRLGSGLRRFVEGRVLRRVARVATLSAYMAEEARAAHGLDPARFVRIPGGVDLARFHPVAQDPALRRELGLPERGPLILTARRLVPRMGLLDLVEAFALLAGVFPDASLAVCGIGPQEAELRAAIAARGLGTRAFLCGHVAEERLPDVLRLADLFVVPSRDLEGFGLALLEAMACGVPVLATPVGGMVEILHAFDRRCLADAIGPLALAAGMRRWLADLPLRAEIGPRAAEFVRRTHTWDAAAAALEGVLEIVR